MALGKCPPVSRHSCASSLSLLEILATTNFSSEFLNVHLLSPLGNYITVDSKPRLEITDCLEVSLDRIREGIP